MKIIEAPIDTFIGYSAFIQKELDRKLTEKEIKECLQMYIKGVKVDKALEEFK